MPEVANIAEKLAPEELKKVEKPEVKPEVLAKQIKDRLEKIRDPELMKEVSMLREMIHINQDTKLSAAVDATITRGIELLGKKLKTEIPSLEEMSEKRMDDIIRVALKKEF